MLAPATSFMAKLGCLSGTWQISTNGRLTNFRGRLEADILRSWVPHHIVRHSAWRRLRRGGVGVGYRANLWLRSSIRVLQLIAESQLNTYNDAASELYAATRRVPFFTCFSLACCHPWPSS